MIKTIGIVGAGTMGAGIAQAATLARLDVLLYDASPEVLKSVSGRLKGDFRRFVEKGRISNTEATEALARIEIAKSISSLANADFVIEAAVEDLTIKREIFKKLDAIVPTHAILATNTSSLSVSSIASFTKTPESIIGMHFFNPPVLMKLVEVVKGKETSIETIRTTVDLATQMKKTPVVCKDTPGFIVNRVARPFYGEALRLLGEGVASVEEIDRIVKKSGGFRMGPFELMDLIGIDINYAVTKSVYEQFFQEPRFRPHPIQRQMVEGGTLGRKTKKGFYEYP
ncbi:MAG TPA: 3-hydroxyacyl-CoA dehydrogenase NAD-binding domain-containing protein [Bacteroidota bacterium]|jgi:3-hydroxybutyryl-CoA dehydrogenase